MSKWVYAGYIAFLLFVLGAIWFWELAYKEQKTRADTLDLKIRFIREDAGEPVEKSIQKMLKVWNDKFMTVSEADYIPKFHYVGNELING